MLVLLISILSIVALLLEHGFYRPPLPLSVLHWVQAGLAMAFMGLALGQWVFSDQRSDILRGQWTDLLVLLGAVLAYLLAPLLHLEALEAIPSYLVLVQSYIALNLGQRGVRLNIRAAGSGIHPARLLVGSFIFLILVGAGLLMLPRAFPENAFRTIGFENALFTSASATCVTGLSVLDTGSDFSRFGQVVILLLMQLGGLGIMIFGTMFVVLAGRSLGLRQAAAVGEMISLEGLGRISRMVKFIVIVTLLIEAIGACLLWTLWKDRPDAIYYSVFHSVSAFCNCGLGLFRDSLISFRNSWQVLVVIPGLIIMGGLGFPVLYDLARNVRTTVTYLLRMRRRVPGVPRPQLMLHSKIVLVSTVLLLVLGAVGLLLVEPAPGVKNVQLEQPTLTTEQARAKLTDWQRLEGMDRVKQVWFHSASSRTAGFNTINLDELANAGKFWLVGLMVVGGSPASMAGGMKTATFAVLLLLLWSILRRREQVEVLGRSLSGELIRRAITLAVLYLGFVAATTLALCVAQGPTSRFLDILFESASACGTVGLSMGETARLTLAGKYVIIAAMFVGRVGPLTLLIGLMVSKPPARYTYPVENVIIG